MTGFRKTGQQVVGFGQQNLLVNQRALTRQRLNDQRHKRRGELFSAGRNADPQGDSPKEPLKEQEAKMVAGDCANGLQRLAKWREERNRRKLLEQLRAKPPFKVGKVHHRWYSPPIYTKYENMQDKQKRENIKNKKYRVIKKVQQKPTDHKSRAPIGFDVASPFHERVDKKRVQTKNYLRNVLDGSVIKFLPEEIGDFTLVQSKIANIGEGFSSEKQLEEEERVVNQCHMYLLNQETERLIRLRDSLELEVTKNEDLTEDIYHLIEDCHARFKKLEELDKNDNWTDKNGRNSFHVRLKSTPAIAFSNPFIKNAT